MRCIEALMIFPLPGQLPVYCQGLMLLFVVPLISCSNSRVKSSALSAAREKKRRPRGYWKVAGNLSAELRSFADESGEKWRMPTPAELCTGGRRDIVEAVRRQGPWKKAADDAGLVLTSLIRANSRSLDLTLPPKRPYGYWRNLSNLYKELAQFMQEESEHSSTYRGEYLPSTGQLKAAHRSDIVHGIWMHGGFKRVAHLLNFRVRHQSRAYWERFENVKTALLQFIDDFGEPGEMPSTALLDACAPPGLASAIVRLHGGSMAVAARLKLRYRHPRRHRGYWNNRENRIAELRKFLEYMRQQKPGCDEMIMPTSTEVIAMGRADLATAIFRHEGFPHMAATVGLRLKSKPRKAHGYWKNAKNITLELREFACRSDEKWRMPTQLELISNGRADLAGAVLRYGTWKSAANNAGLVLKSLATENSSWCSQTGKVSQNGNTEEPFTDHVQEVLQETSLASSENRLN